jgi:hypothetical protein
MYVAFKNPMSKQNKNKIGKNGRRHIYRLPVCRLPSMTFPPYFLSHFLGASLHGDDEVKST